MSEPRIWILPQEVAERIAAGEVVERPASVVKELVENALDAGARRITVETEAGGKALIRVTDDGSGMTPEEARLALYRHATSKLRGADDLFNIHTLGFRGEAMPSIAAVSEMEILTRTPDSTEGTRLLVAGGSVQEEGPAAAQVGTTITVRRLFFNVPVREKFLRSDNAEANQITEWLQRLALSRPDVSFRLVHDGREALLSPGSQDPLNAVVAILGRNVARELVRVGTGAPSVAGKTDPGSGEAAIRVSGFVGRPTLTRSSRALQHTYVNGRAVRSPLVYRALDDAFRATMPSGRYPVAVLFVQVPPDLVDVNVHPAKTEVRFQDEAAVLREISRSIQAALRGGAERLGESLELDVSTAPSSPAGPGTRMQEPTTAAPEAPEAPAAPAGPLPFADAAIGGPAAPDWSRRQWSAPGAPAEVPHRDPFEEPDEPSRPARSPGGFQRGPEPARGPAAGVPAGPQGYGTPAWTPSPSFTARQQPEPVPPVAAPQARAAQPEPAVGELRLLGQLQDLFILAEAGGELWVIDQHVAHERVLFDRMTAPGAAAGTAQPLLIPAVLELDRSHALALEEHQGALRELGFEIEGFGPNRYRLRSVPGHLLGRNYEAFFRDLADELAEQSAGGQVKLDKEQVAVAAAGRSCKRAIKAGQKLSNGEMERLLEDLRAARNPHTCPHGRPVFLTYGPDEIARLFGGRTCEPRTG